MAARLVLGATVVGADRVGNALIKFADILRDLTPFWRDMFAPRFFGAVQESFRNEALASGRADSGRFTSEVVWAPLSPRYAAWKEKHYPGKTKLQREGRLVQSLTWDGSNPGPEGIFDCGPDYVFAGTAVPYGVYHQTGVEGRLPARPFIANPQSGDWSTTLGLWMAREGVVRGGLTIGRDDSYL